MAVMNRYFIGDRISEYAENEPIIDQRKQIYSVSIDAAGKFFIRSVETRKRYNITLESGDVLVMHSVMQETHTNGLGKQESEEARYNLTFRWRREKDEENPRKRHKQ